MSVIAGVGTRIELLGSPRLLAHGSPVRLATRNALLLVARLAVEGPQSREVLAALLWPDAEASRARVNLRRTLAYVREGFGGGADVLIAEGATVGLADGVETDLELVKRALGSPDHEALLAQAAQSWRGEFLAGTEPDGEELDAWLVQQRSDWSRRLGLVCERLVEMRSARGDTAGALRAVGDWLARDPLSETAYRELIRLHLIRSDRPAALDAYKRCVALLAAELGVEPSPATLELGVAIHSGAEVEAATAVTPEPPMVGRGPEHAALVDAFVRARRGSPQLVLLRGEPGIGKSRLQREFSAWARAHGAEVLAMTAFPAARRLAYQSVRPLVEDAEGETADEKRLFLYATQRLDALAVRRPLLIAMDDVQWVDPDSLALLSFAASSLGRSRRRLTLVVTARDEDVLTSTTLRDWIAELARELELVEVRLGPLTEEDARQLVAEWPDTGPIDTAKLLPLAGGRPLALVESLRYAAAGGDPLTIAPALRESMLARVRALPTGVRRLVEAAAVVERPAELSAFSDVAGLNPTEAGEALEGLISSGMLVGAGSYKLSHEVMRQSVYTSLPFERRRELHGRAGNVLEIAGAAADELAHHAELAGDLDRAFEQRMTGATQAMRLPAYRAAAAHFKAAIAIRPDASAAWLGLGRAEELAGHGEQAADTYRRLANRSRGRGDAAAEAAAVTRLAELAGRSLTEAPPTALLEQAAEAASEAGDTALQIEADLAEAQILAYRGRLLQAAAIIDTVRRRMPAGRPDLAARSLNLAAFVNQAAGRWSEALTLAEQARKAYADLGERLMVLDSMGYQGAALVFLGRWREALRVVRRGLDEAERLANPWAVCNLSLVEGWALREAARLQEALKAAERGMVAGIEAGFVPLHVLNATLAGRVRRELGDLSGARSVHEGLIATADELEGVALHVVAEELSTDFAAAGDWEAAARWAQVTVDAWGEMRMFAFMSLWMVAKALLSAGSGFRLPALPAGHRYELVELRTRAVLEPGRAAEHLAAARRLAERFDWPQELAALVDA